MNRRPPEDASAGRVGGAYGSGRPWLPW